MPVWVPEVLKVLRNRSNTDRRPATDLCKFKRNNSVDVHVLTQRSYFVEPPRSRNLTSYCPNPKHHFRLGAPYENVKNDNRIKQRPKPLVISHSLPCLPMIPVQGPELLVGSRPRNPDMVDDGAYKGKEKAGAELKRARRHGMQSYPEDVCEELKNVRSRSSHYAKVAMDSPTYQFTKQGDGSPASVYSNRSGYGDQILVSSPRVDSGVYEPPSWFSDEEEPAKSDHLDGFEDGYLQRIMYLAAQSDSSHSRAGPSARNNMAEPPSAKSWETYHIPSLPPSPVYDTPLRRAPRNPRLPPVDYFLHKEEYDAAVVAQYGALPAEWIQYTAAHNENRV
ncbi:hypothetical protein FRC12_000723 [Ceratobasidium sp. 428]|nr:hypothetical protein FRC12_000723 [Ceratobasidium sp. 428]